MARQRSLLVHILDINVSVAKCWSKPEGLRMALRQLRTIHSEFARFLSS
jgi:hypothetical protein